MHHHHHHHRAHGGYMPTHHHHHHHIHHQHQQQQSSPYMGVVAPDPYSGGGLPAPDYGAPVMHHHHHQQQHQQTGIIQTPPMPLSHHHHHHHHHQHHNMNSSYGQQQGPTSHNVKVHVENCSYPINRDVLEQIFSRVAPPLKIDCGPSGQVTMATVGFADAHSAQRAVSELNNKQIYPNCCRMTLTVDAPPSRYQPSPQYTPHHHHSHHQQHSVHQHHQHSVHHQHHQHSMHHQHHQHSVHHQHHQHQGFVPRGRGRGGVSPYGSAPPPGSSPYGSPYGGGAPPTGEAAVVIVSGVPETISLHALWVLLEVYGNVNSLKRQYSQKENVVAQFQNIYDARGVIGLLHGCPFYGSLLGLKHFAGYVERGTGKTEWNAGPAEDPATQAVLFTSGFHHRTKPSAPYNATQKAKPDSFLFISNLTDTISDDDVRQLFLAKGFEILNFYRKSPVAAIIALESPARSVEALIAMHAATVQERFLRVSFSRYPPGPPPSGAVFSEEH